MTSEFIDMATVLPECTLGEVKVTHLIIDEKAASFSRVRQAATRGREQAVKAGTFAQLYIGHRMVMSDTQMERDTNRDIIWDARGKVLIAGLGIGLILLPILAKDCVTEVTVIEEHPDVIGLIEPHIRVAAGDNADKLTVIKADIFEWQPPRGARYDTIYFDIWPDINRVHLADMRKLHQRFRSRKAKYGQMTSWLYRELREGWY